MLGAALGALALAVWAAQARALYRELDAELSVEAERFAVHRQAVLLSLDPAEALGEDLQAASLPVSVRRASGGEMFRSPVFPPLDWAGEQGAVAASRGPLPSVISVGAGERRLRLATYVLRRPGAEPLAVQVAGPVAPVQRSLARLALALAVLIAAVLATASYGGAVIARRALAPVDDVVRTVERIQAAQADERLEVSAGGEEIDRLVATLNRMLERIGASVRTARRFAADASHELQTPLATMRSALEACLRNGRPPVDQHALASELLSEVDRLCALIRDLRLLSLAEAGRIVERTQAIDLASLATECSEIAAALGEEKAIRVAARIASRPPVLGNPALLRRVVLNLIENALRYSPPSSEVLLWVGVAKGQAMLTVLDHGCGIDAADLPHIFEPFYRADPARARETGGTGLGLAIVDSIVRLHDGEVRVWSRPGRGSAFTVYLPSRPAPERPAWIKTA